MGGAYPSCGERASLIDKRALDEEKRFRETLDRGFGILDDEFARAQREKAVSGDARVQALRHLRLPARPDARHRRASAAWTVDEAGFEARDGRAAQAQRVPRLGRGRGRRACSRRSPSASARRSSSATRRTRRASRRSSRWSPTARRSSAVGPYSKNVAVVTAETPFYGEQGGQMGDTGAGVQPDRRPRSDRVDDTKRPVSTLWVHLGEVQCGRARASATRSSSTVDAERRDDIRAQPLGDAPAALGAAPRARRARHAEGLAGRARSPALRLLALAPLTDERDAARRGSRQRARPRATPRPTRRCWRSTRPSRPARSRSSARSTATPCAS